MTVQPVPGVAEVHWVRGAASPPDAPPRLLVEVPHGADERVHFDACRAQLKGPFPDRLEHFFHANTDEGAWDLGLSAAQEFVALHPGASACLIRCLVPRTFIDCNRNLDDDPSALGGGVTKGLPVYVEHPADITHLRALHRAYCALVDTAVAEVDAVGGVVLVPHTYAPRSVGIAKVEHDIVEKMHWAWAPGRVETWPLRAEVDLITKDADGQRLCPAGLADRLRVAFSEAGVQAEECGTYWLHPASRAARLSARHPGRLMCLEVRRDVLIPDWQPFVPCTAPPERVEALGRVLASVLPA